MSTTEDYLDQLLRNASGEGNDGIGESDSELQSEESIISLEDNADEMAVEDGISLEQAMEMSVDDVLNEMASMENEEVDLLSEEPSAEEPELEIFGNLNESEDLGTGMMSEDEIAAMLEASQILGPEAESVEAMDDASILTEPMVEETQSGSEPEDLGTGMMSEDEIAAMLEANQTVEPEVEVEPEASVEAEPISESEDLGTGMMSEEAIAAMFASSEVSQPEAEAEPEMPVEATPVSEPEDLGTGMMSEEAIAAMFASSEVSEPEIEAVEEPKIPVDVEPLSELEDLGSEMLGDELLSFDDMLAGINEEEIGTLPEDMSAVSEDMGMDSATESSGDDSILDLLNMMSDDEDLKDIGDLLKADEDSNFDISEDELFGEMPTEGEEMQQGEAEDSGKKQGFFAKLFGKKKDKALEKAEADENQQIIKEVEEELQEEEKKAEEKEEKKKKKKAKKDKKGKKKGKAGGEEQAEGEDAEAEDGKKGKKEKKKKVKKEKQPKEIEVGPKEPPLPKKPVILIMLMAASILALVLLSHNLINYQSSISKADSSFINRNYEDAYQNILGVDVKEDDKQLYDRIRVMMKLEAKYEMYLAHIEQSKYDEALNDLIMGVIKYDQYKKDAEELGIQQAFDDELALIEEQLNVVFGVDVDQAREWHNTLSALDYTETVRNVVKAAGYFVEEPAVEEDTEGTSEDLSQFGVEAVE